MLDAVKRNELKKLALKIRIAEIEAIKSLGSGHVGGSLSITDALAVLYGAIMKYDPENPKMEDRDKVVCSKGHAGPALYATLAVKGFFPYEMLRTLNKPGTHLPSHCDKLLTPGIDATTGSLGQGTSQAVGMALGDKLKGLDCRTFLFVGDGEANEGQVWEAAMFTAAKKINNLVWLIDDNKKQLDGRTADILNPFDFREKFEAFGFDAVRIDGNDIDQLYEALSVRAGDKPRAIVLDTVKGKGIRQIEETEFNHSMGVSQETFDEWIGQLQDELAALE
ncbi:MAG: transketolase [Lachnospiraceae bacterium]|nr:transketolase [Lachnospiraceae bacterium]